MNYNIYNMNGRNDCCINEFCIAATAESVDSDPKPHALCIFLQKSWNFLLSSYCCKRREVIAEAKYFAHNYDIVC